jgi:sec-independent protein translocase protein TatB
VSGTGLFGLLENFGSGELVAIVLVALVFLGPDRIPEMARGLGRLIHKVRTMTEGIQGDVSSVMNDPAMKPLRELGEFAARPRQKLTEYALEAEAEARAKREQEVQDAADAQVGGEPDEVAVTNDAGPTETGPEEISTDEIGPEIGRDQGSPTAPPEPGDDDAGEAADAAARPDAHAVRQAEARLRSLAAQTAAEGSPGSSTPGPRSEPT